MALANKPILIIVCGLIGIGKTTLAKALSERLGAAYLSSDIIRKRLAGIPEMEHRYEGYGLGLYSLDSTARTYAEMFTEMAEILNRGESVVLDASFSVKAQRVIAGAIAKDIGADFLAVECRLDENILKERLASRMDTASDGRWEIYLKQKEVFEPVVEIPAGQHIVVDTAKTVEEIVKRVLVRIKKEEK